MVPRFIVHVVPAALLAFGLAGAPDALAKAVAQAPPAILDVDKRIDAGRAALLQQGLARLAPHRAVVVFVGHAEGGVEKVAEAAFAKEGLDPDDLAIAIAVDDRQVGAHVGRDLRARGVDRRAIVSVIGSRFKGHARAGRYDLGALALAEGLVAVAEGAPATTIEPPKPAAPPKPDAPPMSGLEAFGWLFAALMIVLLPILGVVALCVWAFRKAFRTEPRDHAKSLRPARDRLLEGILALDEDATAAAHGANDPWRDRVAVIMAEAKATADRIDETKAPDDDQAAALEMAVLNAEVAIAAQRSAYRTPPAPDEDPVGALLALAREFALAEAQVAALQEKRLVDAGQRAVLADVLAKTRLALTTVPVQPQEARDRLQELQSSLAQIAKARGQEIQVQERPSAGPTYNPRVSTWDTWDNTPVAVHYISTPVVVVHDTPTTSYDAGTSGSSGWGAAPTEDTSGSSSWGGSSASSDDAGSSSWGSSDSSSSDSSYSSSDSGSSSSDSGSSGSDNW